MSKWVLALFALLISVQLSASPLPKQAAIPGGVVIVPLSADSMVKPKVTYRQKPVAVVQSDGQWVAVVGVSLGAKIGTQRLTVVQNGKTSKALFEIAEPKARHCPSYQED
jgi:hypothetical protein